LNQLIILITVSARHSKTLQDLMIEGLINVYD